MASYSAVSSIEPANTHAEVSVLPAIERLMLGEVEAQLCHGMCLCRGKHRCIMIHVPRLNVLY